MLLDVRQEVVLHVHLELIGKRRLFPGVALLDAAGAERIPRKHGVLAICEQVAPHVHGVYLIRIALAERHQALGDVFGQHAGVEPIGDVVKQVVVVEVIRRFVVGRFIEVGQRVQINAVQHAANVVRGKGQLHHLFVIEGGAAVDAQLDELPAEKAIQLGRTKVFRHRGADHHAVVCVVFGDARVGIELRAVCNRGDERRRFVIHFKGVDDRDGGNRSADAQRKQR